MPYALTLGLLHQLQSRHQHDTIKAMGMQDTLQTGQK